MRIRSAAGKLVVTALVGILSAAGITSAGRATDPRPPLQPNSVAVQPSILNGNAARSAANLRLTKAQEQSVERQIAKRLDEVEDSKRVSFNELAWKDGDVEVLETLPVPGVIEPMAGDCPYLYFCVYQHAGFGYPRDAYWNCGRARVPPGVTSLHNHQTIDTQTQVRNPTTGSFDAMTVAAPSQVSFVGWALNDIIAEVIVC